MGFTGRKFTINENYFDTWSNNMAYILGFLTADGYVSYNSLQFKLNPKDIKILEFIREEMGSTHPISVYQSYHKEHKKFYDKASLSIYSVKICNILLNKFGIVQNKSGNENIIFDLPEEYKYDYIRGVFDGDGYVGLNGKGILQSYICSASKIFIEQLLHKLNIGYFYTQKTEEKSMGMYLLRMSKQESIEFRDLIYKDNNCFSLLRKKEIFYEHGNMIMNYYSDEEDSVLYKYAPDWELIENLINRTAESIYHRAVKLGLRKRERKAYHKFTEYQINYILTNFNPKEPSDSIRKISCQLDIPYQSICNKVQKLGIRNSRDKYKIKTERYKCQIFNKLDF